MAKIIFKQKAIDDLNAIWEYTFDKWSEKQDDTYYEALKFDCLQIGKIDSWAKNIRRFAKVYLA